MPNEVINMAGPLQLLRKGSYFRMWLTGLFVNTMKWLEILAVGVYVFDKTASPFLVSLVLFCRLAPMMVFGAALGALAERMNKKSILLAGLALATLVSATLGFLLFIDKAEIWHIAIGGFLSGMLATMEFPIRRNIMGEVCGPERVGSGMALDATTISITKLIGPIIGGILLEKIGLYGAFFLSTVLHIFAIFAVVGLRYIAEKKGQTQKNIIGQIAEGIQYIKTDRIILAVLGITIVINLLALPFASMVPVIGKGELELSASLIGVLASAEAAGMLVGCFFLVTFKTQQFAKIYLFGSTLFLIFLILFSLSSWYTISLVLLFLAGLGHAGFMVCQSTILFTRSNPEVRGRVMGFLSMCIGLQPLGVLHIGMLADYFGGSNAVLIVTSEGLIAIGVCWLLWPELRTLAVRPR
jgi:MFS family permease